MPIPTLPGISSSTVTTPRLTTRVLSSGMPGGIPVLFIHCNASSATFWEETVLALPPQYRAIAPDLRGYGDTDRAAKIDATRGLRDLADDAIALLDHPDLLQDYSATVYVGVLTTYQMLTDAPNWAVADLSNLRFCTSGGAPLPVYLVEKFGSEKGVQFKQGFGMTEFGPGVFALAQEDAIRKAGSIGRPNFFVDARIVDEYNHPVSPGTVGELVLRGPSRCSGYFNDADVTANVVDENGWLHTGDLALMDEQTCFSIVDRKKDMFISGGENIYPTEIEHVLYKHPAVEMCAVVGVPDEKWGEVGKAFVVLKAGQHASEDALFKHMQHYLAGYKVPRTLEFRDSLPISAAGKILKRELVNPEASHES